MTDNEGYMVLFVRLGGVFLFISACFHLIFPKMHQWKTKLEGLSEDKSKSVLDSLHLMNWCQFLLWMMFACLFAFFSHEVLNTRLGFGLLTSMVLFWIIRIVVIQPIYTGFRTGLSKLQTAFFAAGLILFIIPWMHIVWKWKF
jgi:Na+/H+ antiporter NhaD/arsenite permease-like protein